MLLLSRQGLAASLGHLLNFNYSDPRPGFDRSKVKGVLARLVRVNDLQDATALEVAAGAKLTHVVVDTEETGVTPPHNGHVSHMSACMIQQRHGPYLRCQTV